MLLLMQRLVIPMACMCKRTHSLSHARLSTLSPHYSVTTL